MAVGAGEGHPETRKLSTGAPEKRSNKAHGLWPLKAGKSTGLAY
jgi:hypothetical protein